MSTQRRILQQPAFILHHRPFRDSSQLLDVVTRDHGKIALVARGSRRAKSRLAGILRPFLPLRVSWVARTDLGTLTGAEAAGTPAGLRGDAMLSAYYVNELLLHFLHRHDPQTDIYALYEDTIMALVATTDIAASLRSFEIELLRLLGYGLNLEHESGTDRPLRADHHYEYRMEQGAVPVSRSDGPMVFSGTVLQAVAERQFGDPQVLASANRLLREVVAYHLGGKELQSRKVLLEVHRGRIAPSDENRSERD